MVNDKKYLQCLVWFLFFVMQNFAVFEDFNVKMVSTFLKKENVKQFFLKVCLYFVM